MAQSSAPRPPGSAYFEKKGEVHELRQLLRGAAADRDQQKKRDAIKKVIAYMTLGIDVSPLFSEMVMASATTDLVQKKMVYLYLVNYAESNSDLAILAVNTLQKDCRDDDPMIRGLALRSLCSLNLLNMVEYLQPAVQRALEDVNGYVRKTAVIGVLKVFHISKSAVLDSDLLPTLKRLVHDSDAHVVSNTICAVEEVLADEGGLQPTREMVTNMLNRLNQFSEWGQCAVLRLLTKYQVADEAEMFDIMNILDSLLKQSSSAVVLAVTKIFVDLTSNRPDLQVEVLRRLKGPLLTLMAAATPELAYTVLVHIQALCSRGGENLEVFGPDFKQFFCRYNEPSYIKTVKIEILTMLADAGSAEPVVSELSEYVTDVDAEISRRAIRAIGKIAVRVPSTAEMIVGSLTSLLELDIDYVSTEAAVVMKDLVRKYPQQFQRASGAVERCMKIVSEPEGKCAVLWILGEYGLLIEDAPYLLEPMIDSFLEEPSGAVRLEMLTAAVKLFFCRPPEMQEMLGRLLEKAIQESTHPDMRDRALLYYRLLEHAPEEARRVICAPKEVVEEFQEEMDADARDRVFEEFNTLSTVYRQPAAKFVLAKGPLANLGASKMQPPPAPASPDQMDDRGAASGEANGYDSAPAFTPAPPAQTSTAETTDLLGGMDATPAQPAAPPPQPSPPSGMSDLLCMDDFLGGGDSVPQAPAPPPAAPAFTLATQTLMDGNSFQARWAQLPQQPQQQRQMRPGPLTTAIIEDALRRAGIFVIASGTIPPGQAMKFYFYAQQATGPAPLAGGDIWFLTELVVVPGGSAQCSVKAENAQPVSVEQYTAVLWQSLSAYVC
uniref:AP complex subunit beta n=1 Tax=Alexandrium monilatum TaxID=311494 RepID=A0A7S4RGM6_9DINO|mmetsp:Transcript_82347/g.245585  ORF Transcript_82347/g.245585 Transcript_82347/m.245585 type:complete len:833 (+) Transcript_82347:106-2604(+)